MLYCHLPDEGILAMHMFRLQLIHYQPSPQKKKTCSIQPQSLFQLVASNFSTKLCRFAGFFHSWCSQSGHWSFPVGFLSHKRLKRACLAPSVSGNACSVWHKGPYFATIPTAFTEKKGIEVITCRSARPEAEQHPEQKKLSKKEWMAVQVLISLLGGSTGFQYYLLEDLCDWLVPSHVHFGFSTKQARHGPSSDFPPTLPESKFREKCWDSLMVKTAVQTHSPKVVAWRAAAAAARSSCRIASKPSWWLKQMISIDTCI